MHSRSFRCLRLFRLLVVLSLYLIPNADGFTQLRVTGGAKRINPHPQQTFTKRAGPVYAVKLQFASSMLNVSNMPLGRPHERVLFSFYAGTSAVLATLCKKKILDIPHLAQGICLMWASFVLAISFTEAWVKFKAPFLRKHIAVDVGRHVFSALNTVELALATSFWTARNLLSSSKSFDAILPAIATGVLILMAFGIAPLLYTRAKIQLVTALSETKELQDKEKEELERISLEVKDVKPPPTSWHVVYVLLEMLKLTCLIGYVVL